MQHVDTIIIGAGQAGLATSYRLQQAGLEHLVLEQAAEPAHVWRDQRWDSFTMVTPNWTLAMPGAEYDGPDREAFMPLAGIIDYFDRYVQQHRPPLACNTRVNTVTSRNGHGFAVDTSNGAYRARNVVMATGFEQRPALPSASAAIAPEIHQLHSSQYRNPDALPPGGVLVVGSAQSGCQIAEELYQSGRLVWLATGGTGRAPRRYRGKDVIEWLWITGFFDHTAETFPVPRKGFSPPHLSGKDGGHSLNLHQFARDGVQLLGHLADAEGTSITIAPDLHENLSRADGFAQKVQQMIDGYVQNTGLDAPPEELPVLHDGFTRPVVERLDLRKEGISTVLWATGFASDFDLIGLPVIDELGFPIQDHGVSPHTGLFFVGMPWMPAMKTLFMPGMAETARHIAATIAERQTRPRAA